MARSDIQWCSLSVKQLAVFKGSATKLGISFDKYKELRDSGMKWCTKCKQWHPISDFNSDVTRYDGLQSDCYRTLNKKTNRIGYGKRRRMREKGLDYCKDCDKWIDKEKIKRGMCKKHKNMRYRIYYKNNPKAIKNRAIARRRNIKPIPLKYKDTLLDIFNNKCAYCKVSEPKSFDHVIPINNGGKTRKGNIVPACLSCNSSKKDTNVFDWMKTNNITPHPKFDEIFEEVNL